MTFALEAAKCSDLGDTIERTLLTTNTDTRPNNTNNKKGIYRTY